MIKYEVFYGILFKPTILKVNDEETYYKQRSENTRVYSRFFNTWTEAHEFLISEAQAAYDLAKVRLDAAAAELNKVIEFVDPELEVK